MKYIKLFNKLEETIHFDDKCFDGHDKEIILSVKDMLLDLEDTDFDFTIRFFQNISGGLVLKLYTDSKISMDDISDVSKRIDNYLLSNGYKRSLALDAFKITITPFRHSYKAYYEKS